ncbi:Rdx family protein [Chelativorans sp. Marseille-P2723]|uniref:Rdx family protein n=1 Tax=Chelativorans sp. Marseille-P2723 TaxID=2709133 RepID=UPI0032B2A6E8
MAQELLSTYGTELAEVNLRPGSGGIVQTFCAEELIRTASDSGLPDAFELKRQLRDRTGSPPSAICDIREGNHKAGSLGKPLPASCREQEAKSPPKWQAFALPPGFRFPGLRSAS